MYRHMYRIETGKVKIKKVVIDRFDDKHCYGRFRQCDRWKRYNGKWSFHETLNEAKQSIIDNAYEDMQNAINKYKAIEATVLSIEDWSTVDADGSAMDLQSNEQRNANRNGNGINVGRHK